MSDIKNKTNDLSDEDTERYLEIGKEIEKRDKQIDDLEIEIAEDYKKTPEGELDHLTYERSELLREKASIRDSLRIVHRTDPHIYFEISRPLLGDLFIPIQIGFDKRNIKRGLRSSVILLGLLFAGLMMFLPPADLVGVLIVLTICAFFSMHIIGSYVFQKRLLNGEYKLQSPVTRDDIK